MPYVFLSLNLAGRVLSKIRKEKVKTLAVVPSWQTQYWLPMLHGLSHMNVLFTQPLQLHVMWHGTISSSFAINVVHPISQRMNLLLFQVFGKEGRMISFSLPKDIKEICPPIWSSSTNPQHKRHVARWSSSTNPQYKHTWQASKAAVLQ